MSRSALCSALLLLMVLMGGLQQAPQSTGAHEVVVDLTFPAEASATFRETYHDGRSGGRAHRATDLFAPMGTPVYAAVGGTVTWMPGRHGNAGYALHVRGTDGRLYAYYHLGPDGGDPEQAYAAGIAEGAVVGRGQHIGSVGDSGNAAGGPPHLHFEIHDTAVLDPYGTFRINPYHSLADAVARGDFARAAAPRTSRDAARGAVLRLGDRGADVAQWQALLNTTRSEPIGLDGIFGPQTQAATRELQQAHGIIVDGIVGPQTRAAVAGAQVEAAPVTTETGAQAGTGTEPQADSGETLRLLRQGDRGADVAEWQRLLNAARSDQIGVDGIFGPQTDAATRELQRARGVVVDGIVGPQTRAAL